MTKGKQTKFQTAHWKGIVRPQFSPPGELTALSIHLPTELADDVTLATYQYRSRFTSEEEFIATAILYVLKSIAEDPPTRQPERTTKKTKAQPVDRRRSRLAGAKYDNT